MSGTANPYQGGNSPQCSQGGQVCVFQEDSYNSRSTHLDHKYALTLEGVPTARLGLRVGREVGERNRKERMVRKEGDEILGMSLCSW